jgi:RimJ/RimL family protein N-acetyltransferase
MDFRVRRVVPSDREDVLEIARNTWRGHDYLPSVIDTWMKDRNCHVLGVETDGHIVALSNLHVIDSGQTGWMEGLRVHPAYRNQGLAKVLTKEQVNEGKNRGVYRLRYTTDSTNAASISLAESIGMSRRMEMGVFWKGGLTRIRKGGVTDPPEPARGASLDMMVERAATLFPEGIILHDWKAYDLNPLGMAQIRKKSEVYVARTGGIIESVAFGTVRNEDVAGWSFSVYASSPNAFLRAVFSQALIAKKMDAHFIMGTFQCQFEKTLGNEKWMPKRERGFRVLLFEKVLRQPR